jgi:hypothetical protein
MDWLTITTGIVAGPSAEVKCLPREREEFPLSRRSFSHISPSRWFIVDDGSRSCAAFNLQLRVWKPAQKERAAGGGYDARKTIHCADRLIDKHPDLRIVIVFPTAVFEPM